MGAIRSLGEHFAMSCSLTDARANVKVAEREGFEPSIELFNPITV